MRGRLWSRRLWSPVLIASVLISAALASSQAPSVTGTVMVGKIKVAAKAITALGYTAPNGALISVLVSDKPADRKAFLEMTKVGPTEPLVSGIIEGAWKSLHIDNKLSGFLFTTNADGRILSNEFLVGGKNETFSVADDDLVLTLTSTAPRIAGRIRTKEPALSLGDKQVGLDVTFDVPVAQPGK